METNRLAIEQLKKTMGQQLLEKKLEKCNGMLKSTFDWSSCLELEMPWKFGVYDVSMKLPLDYSLHLREETFREGVWKFNEEDLVRLSLASPSYEEEPRRVCEIMQGIMNGVKCRHQELYNTHVLRIDWIKQSDFENEIPSIVSFELGPFVWVVFNKHGIWPAIHRRSDLDDNNYLTYNQKGSDVFVWDNNYGMMRADY
jgi:hypothetical protein